MSPKQSTFNIAVFCCTVCGEDFILVPSVSALLPVVLEYAHRLFRYHLLPPSFFKAKQTGVLLAAATDVFSLVCVCACV